MWYAAKAKVLVRHPRVDEWALACRARQALDPHQQGRWTAYEVVWQKPETRRALRWRF
jgi:hypothetical protein